MHGVLVVLVGVAALAAQPGASRAETPAEATAPASAAATAAPQAPAGRVERSTFSRAVIDREPQGSVSTLPNDARRVYYFTELRDLQGETVTHRWEYQGEVRAEVVFEVGGPRWRVHSSKELDPTWLGEWTVSVLDSSGRVLQTDTFRLVEAPEPAPESPVAPDGEAETAPAAPE